MKKKILSILMCGTLCCGLLAGCGSSESSEAKEEEKVEETEEKAEEKEEKEEEKEEKDEEKAEEDEAEGKEKAAEKEEEKAEKEEEKVEETEEKAEEKEEKEEEKLEETEEAAASVESGEGGEVFEYLTLSMAVEWIQQIQDCLEELGDEYGFTVLNADANYDIDTQLSDADSAIVQGIDGAFLFVVDEGSAEAVVDKFDEAGIPVIGETQRLQDGDGNNIAPFVELDAEGCGAAIAEWVAENWDTCGADITDLSNVGVITTYNSKFSSDVRRSDGFQETLQELLPEIPLENYMDADDASTGSDDDAENSYNLVSSLIASHPDLDGWIVCGTVDNYALGACRAIEAQGVEDETILVSCGGECVLKEWPNGTAECWRATCFYSAMDFAEVMVDGMLDITREGEPATAIFEEYSTDDGQDYVSVGIVGKMITADDYLDYVPESYWD